MIRLAREKILIGVKRWVMNAAQYPYRTHMRAHMTSQWECPLRSFLASLFCVCDKLFGNKTYFLIQYVGPCTRGHSMQALA